MTTIVIDFDYKYVFTFGFFVLFMKCIVLNKDTIYVCCSTTITVVFGYLFVITVDYLQFRLTADKRKKKSL